jgi:pSer/pThr/pTyr-binding forkhead associated (FHA) protein
MKLKLKVLKGSGAGKEVKIPTPRCEIGRGEDCHMRPKSEAVSRRHCAIVVKDGRVLIRDFGSKNGTYVNGQRVDGEAVLSAGDKLQIGPLAFEVLIDHTLGGDKRPKVKSIKEAATRTTASSQDAALIDDSDISDWLDEADEVERQHRISDPETRQLKLDETDQVTLQKEIERRAKEGKQRRQEAETEELLDTKKNGTNKKGPGKLPKPPEVETKDSGEAAAEVLRRFFNSR